MTPEISPARVAWTQKNIVHTQMMVEDRYFYDPVAGSLHRRQVSR